MSNAITPPMRSRPTNATVRPNTFATAKPSGSGPLLSLRESFAFGVPVLVFQSALKYVGRSSAIFFSMASPVSPTSVAPAIEFVPVGLFQMLSERAPNVYNDVKSVAEVAVRAVPPFV